MSKKCVKCGQMIPEDAAFCPHCTAAQTEKRAIKAPRRWKKKAFIVFIIILLLAAVHVAFSMYHKPKTYQGGAQITYTDKNKSYKLLLSFSQKDGMVGSVQAERTETIADGMRSALPCQLYVFDQDTGKLAREEFESKVESCQVETKPYEDSQKMDFVEPVYNEAFSNASYVSDISYDANSGTNDIQWTLNMKNGDTISLSTKLTAERQKTVSYYPEDKPMETAAQLKELLASIDEEESSDTPVYLYLPAVTYDEDIVFGDHVWGIYGSTEGNATTTFTGTVSIRGMNGNYADISGVRFEGNSGTGLNAYCLVLLSQCSFEGWDTAAIAWDGAWINAIDSTFTNNAIALKFNSSSSYGTSPNYISDTFTGNGTAVCIEALPGTEVLDFSDSIFSENDIDIDNKAGYSVDTTRAIFE